MFFGVLPYDVSKANFPSEPRLSFMSSSIVFQTPLAVIMHSVIYCVIRVVFKLCMHSAKLTPHRRRLCQHMHLVSFLLIGGREEAGWRGCDMYPDGFLLWLQADSHAPHSLISLSCEAGISKLERRGERSCHSPCFRLFICRDWVAEVEQMESPGRGLGLRLS